MEAVIILISWYLNAVIDAIDHGKGARSLYELWHGLKFASYAIPFGYICVIKNTKWELVACILLLSYGWEIIYRALRKANFQEWDDRISVPWLRWIWRIRRG